MNTPGKSLLASIAIHGLVVGAFMAAARQEPAHPVTLTVDFSIARAGLGVPNAGASEGERHSRFEKARQNGRKEQAAAQGLMKALMDERRPVADISAMSPTEMKAGKGMLSRNDGQAEVFGEEGSPWEGGAPGVQQPSPGGTGQPSGRGGHGGGDGVFLRYGSGSAEEGRFYFIRDGVMKNIRYPERARRKGLSGKTLLSFTVTEEGRTRDVRVINGSGFVELDNSAKDAVIRTTFSRKIPHKLFVILPVEYRLE